MQKHLAANIQTTHHTEEASAGTVDKAVVPLQSLDASEDAVPVVALSCWVGSRDTSAFQDLLLLGAADQGKLAVPQSNNSCSEYNSNHSLTPTFQS
jgi:hypothetical protein